MAKPEWGQKRTCQSCGTRFYDMKKDPAVCPKCDAIQDATRAVKPKRSAPPRPAPKAAPAPEENEDLLDVEEDFDGMDDPVDDVSADDDDDVILHDSADDDDAAVEEEAEDDPLIEDTSDLDEDDEFDEVRDHLDDELEDKD